MKMIACAGAAFLAVAMLPAEASAAPQSTTTTTVKHNRNGAVMRTTVTKERYGARRGHWTTKCRTWWRHGRKYRSCQRVRVRW